MRTTLTLDPEVHSALQEAAFKTGRSFKATVNDVLRAGLARQPRAHARRPPPELRVYSMGKPLVDLTKANALAAELDDQEYIAKYAQQP